MLENEKANDKMNERTYPSMNEASNASIFDQKLFNCNQSGSKRHQDLLNLPAFTDFFVFLESG